MRIPFLHPHDLVWGIGENPGSTRLRLRSADVASVFLNGYSIQAIADALETHVALIEDAIRWEMKRREKRRARG